MRAEVLRGQVISGVFWMAATKGLGQVVTWAVSIVVIRLLSPQDYGLMGMATLFTGFLLLFNEFGLGAALVQQPDLKPRDVAALRWAIFGINLALFVSLLALAPAVAAYFNEPALSSIFRVLGIAFVIQGIGGPSAYLLTREMAFRKKSQAELIGNLAAAGVTLACAASGLRVWSLVFGSLVQQLTTQALYCVYSPPRLGWPFPLRGIGHFLNFGAQVASSKVLWYGSSNADFLIVGRFLGTVPLGYYSLAFQFSSLPIDKIVAIVTQVAFPAFASLQEDLERLRRYYLKLVSTVALITFPMFLGLFLVADAAVPLVLGSKWLPAVLPLKVLSIVACFRAIETMNGPLLLAKGRPRIVMLNNLLQAVVLPLAFYAGAQYGLKGVSIAWLIVWPVLSAIVTTQTLRVIALPLRSYLGGLKHAVLASTLMVASVIAVRRQLGFDPHEWHSLVLTCLLGFVVYLTYHAVFNRPAIEEALGALWPGRTLHGFRLKHAPKPVAVAEAD